jgi:hypothetical protein
MFRVQYITITIIMEYKRIYLCGNAEVEPVETQKCFKEAEQRLLSESNCKVVNSYELGYCDTSNRNISHERINALMQCDAMYMMNGWFDSIRCINEHDLMRHLTNDFGGAIIYEQQRYIYYLFDKTAFLRNCIHEATGQPFGYYREHSRQSERHDLLVLFSYYCHTYLEIGKDYIAQMLLRDRSTIHHAINQFNDLIEGGDIDFIETNKHVAKLFF